MQMWAEKPGAGRVADDAATANQIMPQSGAKHCHPSACRVLPAHVESLNRGEIVKRNLLLTLAAIALVAAAGCSKPKPTTDAPPAPAPQQQPQAPVTPAPEPPKQAEAISGPIYLFDKPAKPIWDGPASVVIENSPGARPQVGLEQADLVVEALSESEITRTLAFFWSKPLPKIGPVRSARTWLVDMADAYHAPFVHSGGSIAALVQLRDEWGPSNIDEINNAGGYFYRSNDRQPPHNLYINTDLLGQVIADRKIGMKSVPTTPRAPENAAAPAPPSGQIISRVDIDWHRLHTLSWTWNGKAYQRLEDGDTPHKVESGATVTVPNLVFLQVDGVNQGWELGWDLDYAQGGKATVVSGGQTWEGTWTLTDGGFALQPANGAKVAPLLPGPVWVHLITDESSFALIKG
ncbi:MAG: hypothetical protein K0R39_4387 [Symbiobacteriaceae bacterium]|nr:hypothetical protein [Symbiobacteriaceae bacterium]